MLITNPNVYMQYSDKKLVFFCDFVLEEPDSKSQRSKTGSEGKIYINCMRLTEIQVMPRATFRFVITTIFIVCMLLCITLLEV